MQWIPRTSNQQADYMSRLIDTDDYQITEENFLFLDGRWGPIVLIVLPIFILQVWNPNTSDVDFFLSVSSRRKLPSSSSNWYRPRCIALFEISAGRWYACGTSLAFGSFLAINHTQV